MVEQIDLTLKALSVDSIETRLTDLAEESIKLETAVAGLTEDVVENVKILTEAQEEMASMSITHENDYAAVKVLVEQNESCMRQEMEKGEKVVEERVKDQVAGALAGEGVQRLIKSEVDRVEKEVEKKLGALQGEVDGVKESVGISERYVSRSPSVRQYLSKRVADLPPTLLCRVQQHHSPRRHLHGPHGPIEGHHDLPLQGRDAPHLPQCADKSPHASSRTCRYVPRSRRTREPAVACGGEWEWCSGRAAAAAAAATMAAATAAAKATAAIGDAEAATAAAAAVGKVALAGSARGGAKRGSRAVV